MTTTQASTTLLLLALLAYTVAFAASMWVLYIVVRYAIRDGIRESGLLEATTRRAAAAGGHRPVNELPDMRAER